MTKPDNKWYKFWKPKEIPKLQNIIHLDIMFSRESGLQANCKQIDFVKENINSIDENGNIIFKSEFDIKIKALNEKYNYKPDDICKDTCDWNAFHTLFINAMNWGMLDGDNEDYDRESMRWEDIESMYHENKNLYEILRNYIIISSE